MAIILQQMVLSEDRNIKSTFIPIFWYATKNIILKSRVIKFGDLT